MSNRKNQNSILVLATLGVYLGLVFVGATPQVLAQAAMTREFSVKDEIEVKDDLDTKPEPKDSAAAVNSSERDQKIARAVERFLSRFQPAARNPAIFTAPAAAFDFAGAKPVPVPKIRSIISRTFLPVNSFLTVANFARAGLDDTSAI
ncbi:MAG: hypothetical protein ABJA02_02850 [Acidobacteriota bacterium]